MVAGAAGASYVPGQAVRRVGKTRNPWGVWLLGLVSLGFYHLYWYYAVNAETRDYSPTIRVQPGIALLALMFGGFTLGIATIISLVNTGGRVQQAQIAAGRNERCSGIVFLLLSIIGFGSVYLQSQLNKVWDAHDNPPANTVV